MPKIFSFKSAVMLAIANRVTSRKFDLKTRGERQIDDFEEKSDSRRFSVNMNIYALRVLSACIHGSALSYGVRPYISTRALYGDIIALGLLWNAVRRQGDPKFCLICLKFGFD